MSLRSFFFLGVSLVGCFSSTDAPPDSGVTPDAGADVVTDASSGDVVAVGDETWTDGKVLTTSVLVQGGSTVTIAPGAQITAAAGVVIHVVGTLTVSSGSGAHAKISGAGWTGILVTDYGILSADGLDLDGATTALDIEQQTSAAYSNGTINASATPINVGNAGILSLSHATVTAPKGISRSSGSLTVSYLDYDANDHGAFFVDAPTAQFIVDDSTFHNSGPMGSKIAPDLLTVNAATKFHVAYSDITGAHCGFHFEGVDTVEVDHVSVHGVTNGADIWGSSSAGTRTISSSNFESLGENFDESNSNGTFAVTGCYLTGTNKLVDGQVQISASVTSSIPDAKPR